MKLRFHGAVRTVTGSLHIVETSRGEIILLDCGMFQGRRSEAKIRNTTLPVDPTRVKALVLSHAHIDHIGNIPIWVSKGMRCPIFATGATVDLCGLMLRDSAKIQEFDALHVNKNLRPGEQRVEPLYTIQHAESSIALLRGRNYREWFEVIPGVFAIYHDAGHILGSASIVIEERTNGSSKRIAFTGDIGRPETAILKDAEPFPSGADIVLSECTYGDRDHEPQSELNEGLRAVISKTFARGGKVLVPAFALGRTQTIMYALRQLQREGKLPEIPVYVDSPLASGATEITARHPECYDEAAERNFRADGGLFAIDGFTAVRTADESKALNNNRESSIIIAASGMCEAGRILHHLDHGLSDARNTVLIVGFQAEHTLGRRLVEKQHIVKVFGREKEVRAEVAVLNGFSAHAGQRELGNYLDRCRGTGPLFLVHGDEARATAFQTYLNGRGFADVRIPTVGEEIKL